MPTMRAFAERSLEDVHRYIVPGDYPEAAGYATCTLEHLVAELGGSPSPR